MKKLLISGLGGSLFPYLHEKLKTQYDVFYVDSNANLKTIYPDYNFFPAPLVKSKEYPEFISKIIQDKKIDVYIPLIDEEILVAHEIKKAFPQLFLLSPTKEFCELALNKYKLMKKLSELKISHIESFIGSEFNWTNQSAMFVKPIDGRGSRGIRLLKSATELQAYYTLEKYQPSNLLIQENIVGTEYTVGLITNELDQILCIVPKKVISKKGITIEAVIDNDDSIMKLCQKVNELLKPKGAINIQLYKTEKGELKIFEINPRFSTTSIMSFAAGINEIEIILNNYNKNFNKNFYQAKDGLRLIRRWENLFYDH